MGVQTVRHRDYFLPSDVRVTTHASPSSRKTALTSVGLLALSLIAVVGLAKSLAPSIEAGVAAASLPVAVVGIAIVMLVLLPETAAAVRAAARNRLQTSLNLGIGSAIACIGLTIPTAAVVSMVIDIPLELGIPAKEAVLLALTFVVAVLTLGKRPCERDAGCCASGAVRSLYLSRFLSVSRLWRPVRGALTPSVTRRTETDQTDSVRYHTG